MDTNALLPLDSELATLQIAGGKGHNLARLIRAGFPVPGGFIITTAAYCDFAMRAGLDAWIPAQLEGARLDDPVVLEAISIQIRRRFCTGKLPGDFSESLWRAYRVLGSPPVAVRSSATAEDLPEMSFAGQQDTYLNVKGEADLLAAVMDCWSSLWTARAIGYRARNNVSQKTVALAVVVQLMVQSEVSGVLFTANPVTGKRAETVIDATFGLGEILVAGEVQPDHYVVNTRTNKILDITLGAKSVVATGQQDGGIARTQTDANKRQALTADQILALAHLGQEVADFYGAPQDIEWAWAENQFHLLQARPITSLFPLPDGVSPDPLMVFGSFAAVQGVVDPITPLGQDLIRLLFAGGASLFGFRETHESQRVIFSAGERLWTDFTGVMRNSIGRKVASKILSAFVEPSIGEVLTGLMADPRLKPTGRGIRPRTLARILPFLAPFWRQVFKGWRNPDGHRTQIQAEIEARVAMLQARSEAISDTPPGFAERVALIHELAGIFPFAVPRLLPALLAGLLPLSLLHRLATYLDLPGQSASDLAWQITRGMPHNVTTEMDLQLWETAQLVRADTTSSTRFRQASAKELAVDFRESRLPTPAQTAVTRFLDRYGMRGLGEIDFGRERWREDPAPLMYTLQAYLKIEDPSLAPDVVFARGAAAAETAAVALESAARRARGGRFKAGTVRWAVRRIRSLAGLRESPKFYIVRMMGIVRQGLLNSGQNMVSAGFLEAADDLFFLRITELEALAREWPRIAEGQPLPEIVLDLKDRIAARRSANSREQRRRQLPRVLLSDGTAFYQGLGAPGEAEFGILSGSPVSPGLVDGVVRVVLTPHRAHLAPGEILVCPGTDPAWTPLFLTAGGLVTEVGGMMTHGSVVAREYGIPAVVGVHDATSRLKTGQHVRLDGSSGRIEVLEG